MIHGFMDSLIHVRILPTWRGCQIFLNILKCKYSSCSVLCAFCRRLCQFEPGNRGNRDPPATYPKKHRVSRPRAFSSGEFPHFRTVTLPNCLMMGGWHDDVVDVMVGILAMTIVRNPDVFLTKLPSNTYSPVPWYGRWKLRKCTHVLC